MAIGSVVAMAGIWDPTLITGITGACIAGAGAVGKAVIWTCGKCLNKFQSWREQRHYKKCEDEYCKRCWEYQMGLR